MIKNDKTAFSVLAVAAVLAIFFGLWHLKNNIYSPFKLKPIQEPTEEANSFLKLQTKDTDKDGLSDYDEMYLYGTSPYLSDSDSDGISDAIEIERGTDPNCPQGKECGDVGIGVDTGIGFEVPNSPLQADLEDTGSFDIENMALPEIRDLLKAAGLDEATINQLDDNTLKEIYEEALEESKKQQ